MNKTLNQKKTLCMTIDPAMIRKKAKQRKIKETIHYLVVVIKIEEMDKGP